MNDNIKLEGLLSGLKDEDIERTWEEAHAIAGSARRSALIRIVSKASVAIAIAAVIIIGIGIGTRQTENRKSSFDEFIGQIIDLNPDSFNLTTKKDEAYVNIKDHIVKYTLINTGGVDLSVFTGDLVMDGPSSSQLANRDNLEDPDCLNSCDCSWYGIKDTHNFMYLLREDEKGDLSAWQFEMLMNFQEGSWRNLFPNAAAVKSEYGLRETLEVLYQVTDSKCIERIEVSPSVYSLPGVPTDEAQKYVEEIGNRTIVDRDTIKEVLDLLNNLKDIPMTMEEAPKHIRLFRSEQIKDIVESCYLKGTLGPISRYDRQIRLVFSDGSSEPLDYSAVDGSFSYDGARCMELSDSDYMRINLLFGIDIEWSLAGDFGKEDLSNDVSADNLSGIWNDYDAGCYETPAGTLVVCVKYGGEVHSDEIIAAHRSEYKDVRLRFVNYSIAELEDALHTVSERLKDGSTDTGFIQGVRAFGINEIYNRINIYCTYPSEVNLEAVRSYVENPDMIQLVYSEGR